MIDWNRVVELRDEVGPTEFEPVLEMFVDEVEDIVMRLSTDDRAKLERDLHFLKGSAWNLGFSEFGALCQSYEVQAALGRLEAVSVDNVLRCYSASKQLFMRELARMIDGGSESQVGVA